MEFLRGRGLLLALTGGGGFQPFGGWSNAPPIFSFYSRNKKRKRAVHGPKEKNKGTRLRGRGGESGIRQACPCPRRSASGGFGGCRMDKRQFWLGEKPQPSVYR